MIQINENIRINPDPLNFNIEEKKIVSDEKSKNFGKEYWSIIPAGHCGNLTKACNRILEYFIMTDEEVRSIEELKVFIEECKNEIAMAIF